VNRLPVVVDELFSSLVTSKMAFEGVGTVVKAWVSITIVNDTFETWLKKSNNLIKDYW
jgi:hypothetical protein